MPFMRKQGIWNLDFKKHWKHKRKLPCLLYKLNKKTKFLGISSICHFPPLKKICPYTTPNKIRIQML